MQVLELPETLHDEIAEQHVFLLIGEEEGQQKAQLLPDSPQSHAFLRSLPTDIFFWQEDRAAGTVLLFWEQQQPLLGFKPNKP